MPRTKSAARKAMSVPDRRAQILDAAALAFAAEGFHDCDVQVLADQLGIGKGTIYRQFPTKRALFLATVDRGMRRVHEQVQAARETTREPFEQLARAMVAYLSFFDAHPEYVELLVLERAVFKDRKKPTYFEHREANIIPWQVLFRQLMADGRVRSMPAERITNVLSDLMYGTTFTNRFAGRRASFERQAAEILDIVLNGILTDRERARRKGAGPAADQERAT